MFQVFVFYLFLVMRKVEGEPGRGVVMQRPGLRVLRVKRGLRGRARGERSHALRARFARNAEAWFPQKKPEQMRHRHMSFPQARSRLDGAAGARDCFADACLDGEADQIVEVLLGAVKGPTFDQKGPTFRLCHGTQKQNWKVQRAHKRRARSLF